MLENSIPQRLLWFAERVRYGVTFADIGTDHAKLPVFLVKSGKISHAIASDIGEGPIAHARAYIGINGLNKQIDTYVGDGIAHLNLTLPADIAICGMGGETMVKIIDSAPVVKNAGVRLLLQPMTDFAMLRNYLAQNGFSFVDEDIVESDGRMYQCMVVEYSGECKSLTIAEADLGVVAIKNNSSSFIKYVQHRYDIVKKRRDGRLLANADVTEENILLADYEKILKGKAL